MNTIIEQKKATVYCIRSTAVPNKFYFGMSERPDVRWAEHILAAQRGQKHALAQAMRDHGADTFYMTILREFDDRVQAGKAEHEIIEAYGGSGSPLLWNRKPGALNGCENYDVARQRMSQAVLQASLRPEVKAARSAATKKLWADDRPKRMKIIQSLLQDKDYLARRLAKSLEVRMSVSVRMKNTSFIKGTLMTDPDDVIVFLGAEEAGKNGFDGSSVHKSLKGKRKHFKKRVWTYISQEEGLAYRPDLREQLEAEKGQQCH